MASDTDDGLDEGGPLSPGQIFADGKDFDLTMFLSGSTFILGRGNVGRRVPGDNGTDGAGQLGLIAFKLDQQVIPGGQGCCEGFFGRAWHRG